MINMLVKVKIMNLHWFMQSGKKFFGLTKILNSVRND